MSFDPDNCTDPERRFNRILKLYFDIKLGLVKTEREYWLQNGKKKTILPGVKPSVRNQAGRTRRDLWDISSQLGVDPEKAHQIYSHVYNALTYEKKRDYDRSPLGSRRVGRGELKAA